MSELTAKRNQAFSGATSAAYPVLKGDYVEYLFNRLAMTVKKQKLPPLDVVIEAFNTLGTGLRKCSRRCGRSFSRTAIRSFSAGNCVHAALSGCQSTA